MTLSRLRLAGAAAIAAATLLAALPPARAAGPAIQADGPPAQTVGIAVPAGRIDAALGRLDDLVAAILDRSKVPGLAVAVVRDGRTVYAKGFGVRRVGAPETVDSETVFQIASLSKAVGATVVAAQVTAGQVAWDMPVTTALPWFALADPWVTRHVTVGDLYAHRSGLPDHAGDDLEDLGFGRQAILERLRLLPLAPFRASYAYTNFGLTAAAEAVAAASGMDWATLSETALYAPLGMTRTSSRFADFAGRDNRADGHTLTPEGFRPLFVRQPDAQSPAGGVSASVRDMATWMSLVLQGGEAGGRQLIDTQALLPAITAEVIASPTPAATARTELYGFGFGVGSDPSGRTVLTHSGGFYQGTGTNFLMIPSLGLGIVVLSNGSPVGAVEALGREFADLVQYGEITRDWYAGYNPRIMPMSAPAGSLADMAAPASPAPPLPLADYAGDYENAYFGTLQVVEQDGGLAAILGPKGMTFPLRHWDGNRFAFVPAGENAPLGSLSAVDFGQDAAGRIASVTVEHLNAAGQGRFLRP
ncbi:MAG: serine hydrolase [Sneathiellaceae bacterium]